MNPIFTLIVSFYTTDTTCAYAPPFCAAVFILVVQFVVKTGVLSPAQCPADLAPVALHAAVVVSDLLELVQKPPVNLGQLVQPVNGIASRQCCSQNKDAPICWFTQHLRNRP